MMSFLEMLAMALVIAFLIMVMMLTLEGFKVVFMDCYHRWVPWSPPDAEGVQFRSCRKCNLTETRKIK